MSVKIMSVKIIEELKNKKILDCDIPCFYMGVTEYPVVHVIKLKYPLLIPIRKEYLIQWLKIICFKCSKLFTDIKNVPVSDTSIDSFNSYVKIVEELETNCVYCAAKKYQIMNDNSIYEITETHRRNINNHKILKIVKGITDNTVRKFYRHLAHPLECITEHKSICNERPDIKFYKTL